MMIACFWPLCSGSIHSIAKRDDKFENLPYLQSVMTFTHTHTPVERVVVKSQNGRA